MYVLFLSQDESILFIRGGRRTKNIDLILILFYIYAAQSCGKIKYVKNTFLSHYLKSLLTGYTCSSSGIK